jgi:serine-type D-Ala-D-Ala carboxypeptidase/endopeptidase (penicillin-binding protein 4)
MNVSHCRALGDGDPKEFFGEAGHRARSRLIGALAVVLAAMLWLTGSTAGQDGQGAPLPPEVEAIMEKPQYRNASWGLLEVDTATDAVIHSMRATEMFIPASTAKVFSVSAVWNLLGPDHTFTTPVYAVGRREGGQLQGDLVLVGAGDLSLGGRTKPDGTIDYTNEDHRNANAIPGATLTPEDPLAGLKDLARQVRAAGITRVKGDVVIDDRLFSATWDTQPTPVIVNDNLIDLVITPAAPGQPATVTFRPPSGSYVVEASVGTVAADQPTDLRITGGAPGMIQVTGTIAAGSAPLVQVAPVADPSAFARTVFIEALEEAGVRVDATRVGPNPTSLLPPSMSYAPESRVAAYTSPPYREFAKLILKVSHDLGADLGVCLLAVREGSRDCADGFPPMQSFFTQAGVDTSQLALSDGSGGDPADRATPVAVTQMLRYWVARPDFDTFRQALPILGCDGTIADVAVDTPARGQVFAKTGTLLRSDELNEHLVLQAKALAGYFARPEGSWLVFSIVVNNAGSGTTVQPALDANEDLGDIAALLWAEANPDPRSPGRCGGQP